ncbi:MAG: hypothetical protein U0230_11075 [Polyangiales bacterium]
MLRRTVPSLLLAAISFVAVSAIHTPKASAYTWMIRHGYTSCATCHVDPSGGGLLTQYGRAQGALIMSQRWGLSDETSIKRGEYLMGVPTPENWSLGGDLRAGFYGYQIQGNPWTANFVLMQADLGAAYMRGRFRGAATLGVATDGAFSAAIAGGSGARLVSRTFWVGADLGADHNYLVRAGRINVPYGLRTIEHKFYARMMTQTDINVSQEYGVTLAYTGQNLRGEFMGILGNYSISPDSRRQRGYSGYLEYSPTERIAIGASSLFTYAGADANPTADPTTNNQNVFRFAEGAFLRYSPVEWFVLSAEGNWIRHKDDTYSANGMASYVQGDFEPVQGLHLIGTFETMKSVLGPSLPYSYGGWASVQWFFFPHADLRLDTNLQSAVYPGVPGRTRVESFVLQLHVYL